MQAGNVQLYLYITTYGVTIILNFLKWSNMVRILHDLTKLWTTFAQVSTSTTNDFFLPYIGLLSSVALTAGSTSKPNDGIKNTHYHETKSSLVQTRIVLYQNTNVLHSRVGDP